MKNLNSYLKLEMIWKDGSLFELAVSASNCIFSGKAEVYVDLDDLEDFCNKLTNYPHVSRTLFFNSGEDENFSDFSLEFYQLNPGGQIGVRVTLKSFASNRYREYGESGKNQVSLELVTEPAAIDNFQRELAHLIKKQDGVALLSGNDNRI